MSESLHSPEAVTGEAVVLPIEEAVALDGVKEAARRREIPPITDADRKRAAAIREEYGMDDTIKFRGSDITLAHEWQPSGGHGRRTGIG